MDARPVDQWTEIFGKLPHPDGADGDKLMARRVLGDIVGYQHPNTGNPTTRARRTRDLIRDTDELANAMIAFARLYIDAGVRP